MIHYILQRNENYISDATYNRVRLIYNGFLNNDVKAKMHLLVIPTRLSLLKKIIVYIKFLLKFLSLLAVVNKRDVVIVYGNSFYYYLFPLMAKKTNFVIEHNDYPFHEIVDNIPTSNERWSRINLAYIKYASSIITCSSFLKEYFQKYVKDVLICPLVVNVNEYSFDNGGDNCFEKEEYIAYCGNLNEKKDGVLILLESFVTFHHKHPQMKLVLIGEGEDSFMKLLKERISKYNLEKFVQLIGVLPHYEVGKWLVNATILALARPSSKMADGGIPSKVGEYLACGTPCVITKTGDLPNYLNDGIDCFLCDPNSAEKFCAKLEECYLSDRNKVGEMGRKAALQFNYIEQSRRIIDYLSTRYNLKL